MTSDEHGPFMLSVGEAFTIEGCYKKRTFWQWLKREPKEIQTYKVVAQHAFGTEYE